MIVRKFAADPKMSFDFFNDFLDTHKWLVDNKYIEEAEILKTRKKNYRKCLKCQEHFESKGAGNRLCTVCNSSNERIRTVKGPSCSNKPIMEDN